MLGGRVPIQKLPSKQDRDGSKNANLDSTQSNLYLQRRWFFPQKDPVVFQDVISLSSLGQERESLIWPIGVENPVLPIRIRWMEISLPSTRVPAVAPVIAAKSCPQVYNMIPWFGVLCSVCHSQYMLSIYYITILIVITPKKPSWSWSSFWFTTKHQKRV